MIDCECLVRNNVVHMIVLCLFGCQNVQIYKNLTMYVLVKVEIADLKCDVKDVRDMVFDKLKLFRTCLVN